MTDQNKYNNKLQGQRVLIIGGSAGKQSNYIDKDSLD
jgi:hypothetical protein